MRYLLRHKMYVPLIVEVDEQRHEKDTEKPESRAPIWSQP